jgi:hypothetical protein
MKRRQFIHHSVKGVVLSPLVSASAMMITPAPSIYILHAADSLPEIEPEYTIPVLMDNQMVSEFLKDMCGITRVYSCEDKVPDVSVCNNPEPSQSTLQFYHTLLHLSEHTFAEDTGNYVAEPIFLPVACEIPVGYSIPKHLITNCIILVPVDIGIFRNMLLFGVTSAEISSFGIISA